MGPRDAADVISAAASDLVVCTKHLSRLEPGTTMVPCPRRGECCCLRGLETQRYPPAGRLKAMGSDGPSVPVSTRLGRGAAHSTSKPVWRDLACRASTGVQSTHGTPGRRAQMLASGRRRMTMPSIGFGRAQSHRGVQLGSRLSRAPRAQSAAQASGHRGSSPPPPASDDCPASFRDRLMPGVLARARWRPPSRSGRVEAARVAS
jgi:hypothetical protein